MKKIYEKIELEIIEIGQDIIIVSDNFIHTPEFPEGYP